MSTEDRILRLENALATLAELTAGHEQRLARLEESNARLTESNARLTESSARLTESFVVLVRLAERAEERMDTQLGWINQLGAAQAESERKLAALAEAQAHSDRRLDALIDIVRGGRNGQSEP